MPGLTIGDTVPNLQADSTHGKITLHDYIDGSWAIIFSHPGTLWPSSPEFANKYRLTLLLVGLVLHLRAGDFTPVCTTELGMMASQAEEFGRRGVKLIGLSCDDVLSHTEWIKDIEAYNVSFFNVNVCLFNG